MLCYVIKLFFWLMEVAIVNSYIPYSLDKESGEKLQVHLSYRRNLSLWAM
jgi:hypothetical protein